MGNGGQCVMTAGVLLMQEWFAGNWDYLILCSPVRVNVPKNLPCHASIKGHKFQLAVS